MHGKMKEFILNEKKNALRLILVLILSTVNNVLQNESIKSEIFSTIRQNLKLHIITEGSELSVQLIG